MTYDRTSGKYVAKLEAEIDSIGAQAIAQFRELLEANYAQLPAHTKDAILQMINFIPDRRPTFMALTKFLANGGVETSATKGRQQKTNGSKSDALDKKTVETKKKSNDFNNS